MRRKTQKTNQHNHRVRTVLPMRLSHTGHSVFGLIVTARALLSTSAHLAASVSARAMLATAMACRSVCTLSRNICKNEYTAKYNQTISVQAKAITQASKTNNHIHNRTHKTDKQTYMLQILQQLSYGATAKPQHLRGPTTCAVAESPYCSAHASPAK